MQGRLNKWKEEDTGGTVSSITATCTRRVQARWKSGATGQIKQPGQRCSSRDVQGINAAKSLGESKANDVWS